MTTSVQTTPAGSVMPVPVAPTGTAPAGGAAAVTASGNVGLGAPKSAFDRAWDDNWAPPAPEKPRPPMFALQLAGNTELVRQVNTLLYTKDVSVTDLQSLMDLLSTKVMELSINGEMMSVQDRKTKIEANQKERDKEYEVSKSKAIAAQKSAEWDKFWGMFKAVTSVVLSAAVIAAGALTANPLLVAYGGYMMVNAAMDVIDAVRDYQGKEKLGFRLSVGELAGWIAQEAFGADEKTKAIVNLSAEIIFGIAVGGGAAALTASAKAAQAVKVGEQVSKALEAGKALGRYAQILNGVVTTGAGLNKIDLAYKKYEVAESKARMDRLQLIYDQLQRQLEQSQELIKTLSEAVAAVWETAGDRLKTTRDAQDRVWGASGRRNMV